MKICSRCKAEKPAAEFGNRKAARDGLHPYCKTCHSAYAKARYAEEGDTIKRRNKKYREENAEKVRKTKQAYYERNRDRITSYQRNYLTENAEKRKEYERRSRHLYAAKGARRRARLAAQTISLTQEQQDAIKHLYAFAKYLTDKFGEPHHVDHIKPLKGKTSSGLHVPWNLQILHASRNLAKSNKEDW
jgi:5-methylcytosine-specific restriction endonuclease McrA